MWVGVVCECLGAGCACEATLKRFPLCRFGAFSCVNYACNHAVTLREIPYPACYGLVCASVLFVACGPAVGTHQPLNEGRQQGRGECKARKPILGLVRGGALPRSPVAVRHVFPPQPVRLCPVLLDRVTVGCLPRGTRHQLAHLSRHHVGREGAAKGGSDSLEELRGNGAHLGGGHALRVGQNVKVDNDDGYCKERDCVYNASRCLVGPSPPNFPPRSHSLLRSTSSPTPNEYVAVVHWCWHDGMMHMISVLCLLMV